MLTAAQFNQEAVPGKCALVVPRTSGTRGGPLGRRREPADHADLGALRALEDLDVVHHRVDHAEAAPRSPPRGASSCRSR